MRCPNCNERLEGNEAFCPNCGCRIENEPEEFAEDFQDEFPADEKKKSKTPLIIAIVVLAAIVVGGAIGIFGFNLLGDKEDDAEDMQVSEETKDDKKSEEDADKKDAEDKAEDTAEEEKEEEEPISIAIIENPGNLEQYYKLSVPDASATSVVDQAGHDNSARMVLDGKDETSWQEGVDGVGIDEKLTFGFSQESKVKYISFKLGNWRTEDYHWQNNRPKTIEIETDNCTQMITFTDEKKEFWVEFSGECSTDDLGLTIKDVYRGTSTKWNDTCIAEVGIYGTSE